MPAGFQTNAFQTTYPGALYAFQARDRYAALSDTLHRGIRVRDLLQLSLGALVAEYKRMTAVVIECTVEDPSTDPPILFDPTTVQVNILKPDGTACVTLGTMSKVSTGFYRYTHQSAIGDPVGAYLINIKVTSGSNIVQSMTRVGFVLLV